ncbi:diaminopimelate decarboxylase, partial [Acidobacteria bacterium AH-259-D05]|nr:diaminopimelate decarboxylase [Acidobacteria bacterium AH-259-D05]
MSLAQVFHYQNGQLYCEEVALATIAQQVGTPCYVYSKTAIRHNFDSFRTAFERLDPLIFYALKANSNLSILRLLKEEGSGFDVVSGGELYRLKKIEADPKRIIFSGVGKTVAELEMALEMSLLSLNIESVEELETLIHLAQQKDVCPDVSLRINPNVDSPTHPYVATGSRDHKFGIDPDRVDGIMTVLKECRSVRLVGLGFHIGSQILDIQPFLDAFTELQALAREFEGQGFEIQHLDLGGGIGIPYRDEDEADLNAYADFLVEHQENHRILFEPGRYIVGNTGVLLSKVLYRKESAEKNFVIVDGAMNDLIRPSLYQAYHEIRPLEEKDEASTPVDVVGPVCETGDFFAQDRKLPQLDPGDFLAVMNAGAYGFVAASNYNSRPRAPEIWVDKDRFEIIRTRESLQDCI